MRQALSLAALLALLAAVAPPPAAAGALDAAVGRRVQALARRNGSGRVFAPNPVNALGDRTLVDGADADDPAFAPAYATVELRDLAYDAATGRYYLRGLYVSVTDAKESPFLFPGTKGIISSRTGSFSFGRDRDQFEHVMAYYHIDANQRYIRGLGFTAANGRPILVDPHGAKGANASRYVPTPVGRGYLALGDGGVDDAEDADMILHVYAHAVQDNQAPGKYLGATGQAAAMGEGFADYWAASSTYEWSVANGFDPACIGEWNKATGCVDRVDSAKRYPADATGSAQGDGQIWSAALWDLLIATNYDRGATDSIILRSHELVAALPAAPTFADGAKALLDADAERYGGAHQAQICSALAGRGLPAAGCQFTATVTWDNPLVDLDLHLRPPDGAGYAGWDYANDCYSQNPNPDWGAPGDGTDNPLLKVDCRYKDDPGCHEEQIVLRAFGAPGAYDVLVHYYDHSGFLEEPTTATIRVHHEGTLLCSGSLVLNTTIDNLPDTGDLWKACTVTVAP